MREGARARGWGGPLNPLNSINPVNPEGPEGQPGALGHSPRAQGGTVANSTVNLQFSFIRQVLLYYAILLHWTMLLYSTILLYSARLLPSTCT